MRLDHYPTEFQEICAKILEGKTFSITFADAGTARSIANRFYEWRVKCRAAGLPIPGLEETAITVIKETGELRWWPRSENTASRSLRTMLETGRAREEPDGTFSPIRPTGLTSPGPTGSSATTAEEEAVSKTLQNWLAREEKK